MFCHCLQLLEGVKDRPTIPVFESDPHGAHHHAEEDPQDRALQVLRAAVGVALP